MRSLVAIALIALVALAGPRAARGEDDAAAGYAKIRPSLVKVWSFDAQGRPFESGSGIVIVSNAERSLVLTAAHVVAGAVTVKIDIDRDRHDIVAHVQQRGPRDLAVLLLDRGGLTPATFAPRSRAVVEGILIAVAGFVKHDELIGVVGQEPRLLYPGTISSRPEDGAYLELENVHIEEGLSGGPVFDPDTGDVLGIVTSRTSDQRGGFADSAALVVQPFLASSAIAFHERDASSSTRPVSVARAPVTAVVRASMVPVVRASMVPVARASLAPVARSSAAPVLRAAVGYANAAPSARPAGPKAVVRTSSAPPALVVLAGGPRSGSVAVAAPTASPTGLPVWDVHDASAHRVAYDFNGCAVVLSLSVAQLAFGASAANARLTLRVARRVAPDAACADIAESNPS
jgi:hypothetical protein